MDMLVRIPIFNFFLKIKIKKIQHGVYIILSNGEKQKKYWKKVLHINFADVHGNGTYVSNI